MRSIIERNSFISIEPEPSKSNVENETKTKTKTNKVNFLDSVDVLRGGMDGMQ